MTHSADQTVHPGSHQIDSEFTAPSSQQSPRPANVIRTPDQLFADYCAAEQVRDARVAALFAQLHDEVTAAGAGVTADADGTAAGTLA